jgi:hypothetical protein
MYEADVTPESAITNDASATGVEPKSIVAVPVDAIIQHRLRAHPRRA